MADPWLKFYPQDWRADERLRNCTLTARGLWIEMIALMHRSDRYGYLLVNGKAPTDRQLAVQAGATAEEVGSALAELEAEAVFSRDRNGTIYSRRMIRDQKKANHARKIGKKGGNPKLSKQTENCAQDNGTDKPDLLNGLSPICQKPEARVPLDKESNGEEPDKILWDAARAFLKPERADPGSLIGKWCRDYGKHETAAAITQAQLERPALRIPFIEGILRKQGRSEPVVPL